MSARVGWRLDGMAAMGDADGPIYLWSAVGVPGLRRRTYGDGRVSYERAGVVYRRLRDALSGVVVPARYVVRPRGGCAWSEVGRRAQAERDAREAVARGLRGVVVVDRWTGQEWDR